MLNSTRSKLVTTEEQVLTMLNCNAQFASVNLSIYRVWTAYRNYDVPANFDKYTFLHLTSEKTFGLSRLFEILIEMNPDNVSSDTLDKLIGLSLPIQKPFTLYPRKIAADLRSKILTLGAKFG